MIEPDRLSSASRHGVKPGGKFKDWHGDTLASEMIVSRESFKSASVSLMIVGFFMLFFSFAFIIVFPESEHSAFPYPLGVPGIAAIIIGVVAYLLSGGRGTFTEKNGPAT